jgi:hypothetical protein
LLAGGGGYRDLGPEHAVLEATVPKLAWGSLLDNIVEGSTEWQVIERASRTRVQLQPIPAKTCGTASGSGTSPALAEVVAKLDRLARDLMWALTHGPHFRELDRLAGASLLGTEG